MKQNEIEAFKTGIFALRTRRFGTVAELMIQRLQDIDHSNALSYDLHDKTTDEKVEVKFSTVMKENEDTINLKNVIDQCYKANLTLRMMLSTETKDHKFDCNIQQVKRKEFDVLYYGLFFNDKIAVFKMNSNDVLNCVGYSDKQHRGNIGEGQFHINNDTFQFHIDNHFLYWLTYEELFKLFATKP
ncbi:MAG: hypothetical protein A2Y20_10425 [Firmicutes bacterium GWF2_51_9]|nr:MAG: hypothetical protein A2Y20_10425 [Firmicutes bacterium GWF2_51_9]